MKFSIEINDGALAGMYHGDQYPLVVLLTGVAEQVEQALNYAPDLTNGPILDVNRLTVGHWSYAPGGEPEQVPDIEAIEREYAYQQEGREIDQDDDEASDGELHTRVVAAVGDPGRWQAQYHDAEMGLWFDIGDAQTDKTDAEAREADYRRAMLRGQPGGEF